MYFFYKMFEYPSYTTHRLYARQGKNALQGFHIIASLRINLCHKFNLDELINFVSF